VRRAVLIVGIIVAVWSPMPVLAGTPHGRTFVTRDCLHAEARPQQIVFTCADGGFYMTQGAWTSWHTFRAVGSAVFHLNDCTPSCAGGTFHTMRGTVVLRRRERCPDVRRHHHVFTRALITFDEQFLGQLHRRAQLPCPNH